ncbi:patj homolog [Octopus vulgaris]|uniref:Patj homolog n=1 Tax=Octopus vulgaris TaxID=6645 RepID=A0AA36BSF7_OCTVU|nr:patj homolog [Octopus vulgaris]
MSLIDDSQHAVESLRSIESKLHSQGITNMNDDLTSMICMLGSPVFQQIINLLDSVDELTQVLETQPIPDDCYSFTKTGDLVLNLNDKAISSLKCNTTLELPDSSHPTGTIITEEYKQEFQKAIESAAKGRSLVHIKLYKPENTGLGFGVVGMKDPGKDDSVIYINDIQPGSVAASDTVLIESYERVSKTTGFCQFLPTNLHSQGIGDAVATTYLILSVLRDGRLQKGDQILAIDGQPLDFSHKAAIQLLKSARGPVELVVARSPPLESSAASNNTVSTAQAAPASPVDKRQTPPQRDSPDVLDQTLTQSRQETLKLSNENNTTVLPSQHRKSSNEMVSADQFDD